MRKRWLDAMFRFVLVDAFIPLAGSIYRRCFVYLKHV